MALVIRVSVVIAKESHRILGVDVLRVIFDELLHTLPESWNCLDVFIQAQDEAVLLLIVLHKSEWIVVNVAEELHARLHAPVVFELVHDRMAEEEARLVPTHVPIADGVAVDDLPLPHILANSLGLLLIDP